MTDALDAYAERLSERVGDWERATLRRIGGRIKRLGRLSVADLGALDNIAVAKRDFHAVMRGLSAACSVSTDELYTAYAYALEELHEGARAMYDFRGKQWPTVRDTPRFSALCRTFAANTGGTMSNLTRSGAVGFTDRHGHFERFEARYARVLDRATVALCSGATDVNTAVRDALNELGSSGLCVQYRGTTRRAASAVRANILWCARQAARGYADALGEELGCDGIEISAHAGCRPSHEFMQGRQYSLHGERVVNGITYPDAAPALAALEEYGCRHTKFPIILGVSAPSQSAEALSELNARRDTPLTVNGEQRTVGEWEAARAGLNSRIRARRDTLELLSSSGDAAGASGVRRKLNALYERRSMIDDALLTNRGNGGIIDVHWGKQDKHILASNNYIEGKSYFIIPRDDIETVIQKGTIVMHNATKQRITSDRIIAVNINPKYNYKTLTNEANIHRSKSGVHLVPTHTRLRDKTVPELQAYCRKVAALYYNNDANRITTMLSSRHTKRSLLKGIKSLEKRILKSRGEIT